jgi:hypothetical protein
VCLAIYVGTERAQPNETSPPDGVRLLEVRPGATLFRRRAEQRHKALVERLGKPHVYLVNGGCACPLMSDGDDSDDAERMNAIAGLRHRVELALKDGPVTLLICWGGDEDKDAAFQNISASDIGLLDFDSVWERPLHLSLG